MGLPESPLTLQPEQIQALSEKLSMFRHNVNNHLSLIIAASELIRRKPEMAGRMVETLCEQPQKIVEELKTFSGEFEKALEIRRDS